MILAQVMYSKPLRIDLRATDYLGTGDKYSNQFRQGDKKANSQECT